MICESVYQDYGTFGTALSTQYGISSNDYLESVFSAQLTELSVGRTIYKLIRPSKVRWWPTGEGDWMCSITGIKDYQGIGNTRKEAFDELRLEIHTDFQRFLRKPRFEMSEEESLKWIQLSSVIDLLEYKLTTPLELREIGCVSYQRKSRPTRIKWLSGYNYIIDPEQVPPELMSCKTGQWIEAVVKRDPVTYRELSIDSISKISFRIPSDSDIEQSWEDMPKADLPEKSWDW